MSVAIELEMRSGQATPATVAGSQIVLYDASPLAGTVRKAPKWDAAIICLASFTIVFTACGTLFAFGVYQDTYQELSMEPGNPFTGASPALIDLIGTLGVAFMTIGAPYTTAWAKAFSPRLIIAIGGILFAVAAILASFCVRFWQIILSQGLLLGVATSLAYMPAVTVSPTWYDKRRALAMGIITSGTGVGGVVWAPLTRTLIHRLGWRNSLRITGGVTGLLIVAGASVMRWDLVSKDRLDREKARRQKGWFRSVTEVQLLDLEVAKSRAFAIQLVGSFLQAAAYYTPVFFFSSFARTLGFSSSAGANFIALSNAANALGKIGIGLIADRYGRWDTLFVATFLSGASSLALWLPATFSQGSGGGKALFIAYTVMYGCFASPYVSLFPAGLVDLFGPANFLNVNGCLYMARGIATLIGTPVAGALIRGGEIGGSPEGYWRTSVFVSVLLIAASAAVWCAKLERR